MHWDYFPSGNPVGTRCFNQEGSVSGQDVISRWESSTHQYATVRYYVCKK